jgi:peroxiredoxin
MHGLALILALLASPAVADEPVPIGRQIENFQLHDYLGTQHSLEELSEKKAVVVVFLGVECPLAKLYGPRLAELADRYQEQGVAFVGIDSNRQDTLVELAHYARTHGIEFPLLKDPGNAVADQFGARRTPEVFLLDGQRRVRYWGRIDDQYGVGYARPSVQREDLAAALDELLKDAEIREPMKEPVGCLIGKVMRTSPAGDVTYARDIAPIVQQHCVACHRPGEVAPFELTQYEDVAAWADTIQEVIHAGRMPPWHANPQHGKFANDARLPEEAKQKIEEWIAGGCPQGDLKDLPPPREFHEGWYIPQPDLVLRMPEPFEVPAKGTVEYQHFTIDPGWTEDKWIKAAECRPGNRAVTHHLILFFHPPGKEEIDEGEALFNSIVGFAPGLPPSIYPEGVYRRVPAGSKLIIQAHYTPNGTPQTDQSEVGLVFADPASLRREMQVAAALNFQFRIPPGADNFRIVASRKFEQDSLLYALTPHMHLRGKSFRFEAVYPDGSEEILLDVPRYDFNWQNTYGLAEPKRMPEGAQIRCTAHYDNSAENLVNPDPTKTVKWGDQTWQEMMIGTFSIALADQDLARGMPRIEALGDDEYEVTFSYRPTEKVEAVYLAGTFNDWKPAGLRMEGPDENGSYTIRQKLAAGVYEYKYVLDGKRWRFDPGNPTQTGFYHNSRLRVGK